MKWLLVSTLMLGMNLSAPAQIDVVNNTTTERLDNYVLSPNNLKANTGRLLMNFPTGTAWTIYVYKMSDGKYVTSYSHTNNPKSLAILPGEYKITLNNALLANVPVKKGHDTRLRVGVLKVDINDVWYLYDETGEHYCISGNKPATLLMPAGKYLLKYGDIDKPVIVEESTGNKGERTTIIREKYIMVPIEGDGRLFIPKHNTSSFSIRVAIGIYKDGDSVFVCGYGGGTANTVANFCPQTFSIPEGAYEIRYAGVRIDNVEIRKGYETRLKLGYFTHSTTGLFGIRNEDSDHQLKWYDSQNPVGLPWPIGKYKVTAIFVGEQGVQEINDDKTTTINPLVPPTYVGNLVVTTPMVGHFPKNNMGRLVNSANSNSSIQGDTSSNVLWVRYPNSTAYLFIRAGSSHDLSANTYTAYLNGVDFKVTIEPKHEGRPRVGYLDMLQFDVASWELYHATNSTRYSQFTGPKKIAVPVGLYRVKIGARFYLVKIKEDETLKFAANLNYYPDLW